MKYQPLKLSVVKGHNPSARKHDTKDQPAAGGWVERTCTCGAVVRFRGGK